MLCMIHFYKTKNNRINTQDKAGTTQTFGRLRSSPRNYPIIPPPFATYCLLGSSHDLIYYWGLQEEYFKLSFFGLTN